MRIICQTRSLSFSVGGKTLLDSVSVGFPQGNISAILGANGAGKSTLLRLLTAELTPSEGEIKFKSRPLAEWNLSQLATVRSVLSQSPQLAFPFTVEEVVMLGLEVAQEAYPSWPKADKNVHLKHLLQRFDLWEKRHQNYLTLSGGEQQRTQLARVWAQIHPQKIAESVLFLDEWSEGLDLKHQAEVSGALKAFCAQGGSVVMVLHDLNLVARTADFAVAMQQGSLTHQGTIDEILTAEILSETYGVSIEVYPFSGKRFISVK
jgi:iron complex transport system ATP-binding protein